MRNWLASLFGKTKSGDTPLPHEDMRSVPPPPNPNIPITMEERVLCVSAKVLDNLGRFQGVLTHRPTVTHYCDTILDGSNLIFLNRPAAEKDPSFKQIIPYTILRRMNHVFCYQRTKKGGESRLYDLWSIGVGGHINAQDGEPGAEAYEAAFWRELAEEVSLRVSQYKVIGLLNDDSNDVGQVHFGIVHEVDIGSAPLKVIDKGIANGIFKPVSWHKANIERYENWSKLVIEHLL